jgi:23S rRNA pseudouridine1911/1915/1917 synthase
VGPASTGMRLDAFVGQSAGMSAVAARRLIGAGAVRVDNRIAAKGARVVAGAVVEIANHPDPASPVLPDATAGLLVIYEDEHLIAIDKPANMPSHPLRPGERGTAANAIVGRFPECAAASFDPREGGLVHRLDTATSGVLIAARSRVAWDQLRQALSTGDCEKRYLCEVWGVPPDTGRIIADIGRTGRRGAVVRTDGGRRPRAAETLWTVVARGDDTALVEARLHAGRAHQVRAHLAAAGFPLVGDDRYGGVRLTAGPNNSMVGDTEAFGPGLHLHAVSVRFRHPVTAASLLIEASLPAWARRGAFGLS